MNHSNIRPIDEPASDGAAEPKSEAARDTRTHASAFEPDDGPPEPDRIEPATNAVQAGIVVGNENFMKVIQAFDAGEAPDLGMSHRDASRSKLDHLSAGSGGDEGLRIGFAHWARASASKFFTRMFENYEAKCAALTEMERYFGDDHPDHWAAFLCDVPTDEGTELHAASLEQALRATLLQACPSEREQRHGIAPGWLDDEDRVPRTTAHGLFSKAWFAGSIQAVLRLRAVGRWQSQFWWDEVVHPAIDAANALPVTTVGGLASMVAIKNSLSGVPGHLRIDAGELVDGSTRYPWDQPIGGFPDGVDREAYLRDWHALVIWRIHVAHKRVIRERMQRIWDYWYEASWGRLPLQPKPHHETREQRAIRKATDAAAVLEYSLVHTGTFMAEGDLQYVVDTSEPDVTLPVMGDDDDPVPIEVTTPPHVEPLADAPREDPLLNLGFPLSFVPSEHYRTDGRGHGAPRHNGRQNAGCDLVARAGTPVYAVDDGVISRWQRDRVFFEGTRALEVRHDAGFVGRYCQIGRDLGTGLRQGDRVTRGQVIAYVGRLRSESPALHFEMYEGTESGELSNRRNGPFQRRADLMNPTDYLTRWECSLPAAQPDAPDGDEACADSGCAAPPARSAAAYDEAIDALRVETNTSYERYWGTRHDRHPCHNPRCNGDHPCPPCSGDHTTHCNIFAGDVIDAMGLPVPHRPIGRVDVWNDWMSTDGRSHHWQQVEEEEAQARADQGYPTLVLWPGHVAVVRPGGMRTAQRRDFDAVPPRPDMKAGPTTAQAGEWNWNRGGLSWADGSPTYWTHD